jgi:hypothetical protein
MIVMVGGDPQDWGFIPGFLSEKDPRPAKEQFNERYVSGWCSFKGFTFDEDTETLKYPGDPIMHPLSAIMFRDETILLYPHQWILILQPDHTWDVARMD